MFPAPFHQISAKEHRGITRHQQLPLKPLIITLVLLNGRLETAHVDGAGSECPAGCICNKLESYVNSRLVKCSDLDLAEIPLVLHLETVHTLDLSSNGISILRNASFSGYSRLSTLILSYNDMDYIEINAFAGLQMMRDIDLQYNTLMSFNPEIFSSNPVMENVSLKGNRLAYLPLDSPILISDSISSLDLSSCSLTAIPAVTFSRLPSLYSLDLSSNLLQTISVSTFEKLPGLRILELNNNRWTCSCDVVEVMQWATARREQIPAHKPVRCLEGQQYRILWTPAGGSKPCSESKTTEALVPLEREFATDMIVDVATVSESETRGSVSLFSSNVSTLMMSAFLIITLGGAVFVTSIAVHYITKRFRVLQHEMQGNDNYPAASFSNERLLDPQITADLKQQRPGYVSKSSDGVRFADYHVYEQIK